jgi:hypothetical protein
MKTLSFFQITLFVLVLFISQNAQAQWVQNTNTKNITTNSTFNANSNARVGIGTINPTSKLEIVGQDGLKISGYEPFMTFFDGNSNLTGRIQSAHGDMAFFKGDAAGNYVPQMVIKDNGNIGIGYAAPESKLDIAAQDGLRIFGYQPFMTLLDNNTYHSARIQAANGDIIFYRGIANWTTGKYDFSSQMVIKNNGNVGIGTTNPTFKLAVNGTIRAKEIRVESNWADYVFAPEYQLRPLEEVEAFIKENKHLPEIQPASEIQENGLDVAATTTKMMAKIEELTLYLIDLKARIQALEKQ